MSGCDDKCITARDIRREVVVENRRRESEMLAMVRVREAEWSEEKAQRLARESILFSPLDEPTRRRPPLAVLEEKRISMSSGSTKRSAGRTCIPVRLVLVFLILLSLLSEQHLAPGRLHLDTRFRIDDLLPSPSPKSDQLQLALNLLLFRLR